jgi:hypothetical protein
MPVRVLPWNKGQQKQIKPEGLVDLPRKSPSSVNRYAPTKKLEVPPRRPRQPIRYRNAVTEQSEGLDAMIVRVLPW